MGFFINWRTPIFLEVCNEKNLHYNYMILHKTNAALNAKIEMNI